MPRRFLLLALTLSTLTALSAQDLFRFPALSPDGQSLAFSYQGDIWTVPATGGDARRLTIHESYEYYPVWSPDGAKIAFVGNRYGNNDIFVTDAQGSLPQRLTYHSTSDAQPTWANAETVFFITRRMYAQVERTSEFHSVDLQGGTPVRVQDALGSEPAVSPDGRYLAFVRGHCRTTREAYRGPANKDIWLYDRQTDNYTQLTTDEGQDIMPKWTADGSLYFLSARNGRYNLYRMQLGSDTQPERLTNFRDKGIRHYDLSADGSSIVIEKGMEILLRAGAKGSFKPVAINITRDFRFYPTEKKTLTRGVDEFALSPDEKLIAFGNRGELFVKPNDKEKKRSANVTDHPYRDRNVAFLNDSTVLFLSDRTGQYELYLSHSAQADEPNLLKTFEYATKQLTNTPEDETSFVLSPDRQQIAVQRGRGMLLVYDIDSTGTLSNERTLLDGWDTPGDVSWSPDSKWLAYALSDLDFNNEIYIHAADNSQPPVNVTLHPRGDSDPVWSRDGRKLGFLSVRNNGDADVWFVWLRQEDYDRTQRDWEELEDEEEEKKENGDVAVVIDFENIHERLVQVTSDPGNERNLLIGPDSEYFYYTTNGGSRAGREGTPALMKTKWDGSDTETLLADARVYGLQLDAKGKKIYMLRSGGIASTGLSGGKVETQSVEAKMLADFRQEREQIYEEGWRALNAGFYDPEFHGRDFAALKAEYKPLALAASTQQDFADIFNEMLGQLNASHMGYRGGDEPEETQRDRTGYLGVEIDRAGRITYVLPDGPADRDFSRLQVGDRIVSVNGAALTTTTNLYSLLEGTANERTLVRVDRNGTTEDVVIRPATSVSDERYEAWVDQRKRLTERYSNGRLGYIHIEGMNWPSFERFERELMAAGYGKDGIVIDVRYNGGGWTTDMLMTVLNVRQHAYTVPRGAVESLEKENKQYTQHYPFGERLPLAAWTRPSIALCNEASYSNAEIFSHAYKHLGHGTLVGQPTFGAVISTGAYSLLDGSYVRMPFRAWYVSATGENMEGGPAVPDVIVENPPASKARDEDPQLRKAVELLLGQVKK
jgi:Tol biopolymer transport system component